MKTYLTVITLLLTTALAVEGQSAQTATVAARLQAIEDRVAIKALVDTFSVLADRKDVQKQILLFTEDATVESYVGGQLVSSLAGRQQIGDAFGAYLARFQTVYHMNGQQTIELRGDRAAGVSYCLVVLIGIENGKTIRHTASVYYHDEYVRRGNAWLIAKRVTTFAWRDRAEVQP